MIEKIIVVILSWLEKEEVIPNEKYSLYAYAAYCFLFGMGPLLIVTILGIVFGMLQEGILLIIPFMLIRKFSGGFHLDSARLCVIVSSALIAVALCVIKVVIYYKQTLPLTILVLIASICLCRYSPIDCRARRLTKKEVQYFKTVARFLTIIALIVFLILQCLTLQNWSVPIGVGIVLAACLQAPCIKEKDSKR